MTLERRSAEIRLCDKLAVDSLELQKLLGCGRYTANEIGVRANARIKLGKRVLWNVSKVQKYLDEQSENEEV